MEFDTNITVKELRKRASELKIKGCSKAKTKSELIELLIANKEKPEPVKQKTKIKSQTLAEVKGIARHYGLEGFEKIRTKQEMKSFLASPAILNPTKIREVAKHPYQQKEKQTRRKKREAKNFEKTLSGPLPVPSPVVPIETKTGSKASKQNK